MVVALVRRLSEAVGETRARRRRKNSITGLRVLGAYCEGFKVVGTLFVILVGLQKKRTVGIRRRMINYWYSVVTALSAMCCAGLFFFSFLS